MKYSMKCTCGHIMTVDAESREQAVELLKDEMTEERISEHMDEMHPGEPVPSQEQFNMMIEQKTVEGDLNMQSQTV